MKNGLPDAIINLSKSSSDCTLVPNDLILSPLISLDAKGVGALLWSLPAGEYSISELAKMGKGGEDVVRSAIKELEEHGFLPYSITLNPSRE